MSTMQEAYRPYVMAAGTSLTTQGINIGGFICVTTGTMTITRLDGTVVLNAFPVTAGTVYKLMMHVGHSAVVALTSAAGTILIGN